MGTRRGRKIVDLAGTAFKDFLVKQELTEQAIRHYIGWARKLQALPVQSTEEYITLIEASSNSSMGKAAWRQFTAFCKSIELACIEAPERIGRKHVPSTLTSLQQYFIKLLILGNEGFTLQRKTARRHGDNHPFRSRSGVAGIIAKLTWQEGYKEMGGDSRRGIPSCPGIDLRGPLPNLTVFSHSALNGLWYEAYPSTRETPDLVQFLYRAQWRHAGGPYPPFPMFLLHPGDLKSGPITAEDVLNVVHGLKAKDIRLVEPPEGIERADFVQDRNVIRSGEEEDVG